MPDFIVRYLVQGELRNQKMNHDEAKLVRQKEEEAKE